MPFIDVEVGRGRWLALKSSDFRKLRVIDRREGKNQSLSTSASNIRGCLLTTIEA